MSSSPLDQHALGPILEAKGYSFVREIGCGGSGRCCLVFSSHYQTHFVVKVLSLKIRQVCSDCEIIALKELTSPFVISIYDYHIAPSSIFIFLEFCPRGSLQEVVTKTGPLSGHQLYGVCKAMLTGLAYVHSQRCAHLDLKPGNILIDRYGRPKLADFGFSHLFVGTPLTDQHAGSLCFMAPELFEPHPFDPFKADIWAAAITIFWIASAKLPWSAYSMSLPDRIAEGIQTFPATFDQKLCGLLRKMTQLNPARRPTAQECLDLEPIVLADIKCGTIVMEKGSRKLPTLSAPAPLGPPAIRLLMPSERAASVRRIRNYKRRPSSQTFDSDGDI
jgi:serine/threonine protein kinase